MWILEREGLSALSMRRIAQRLDTGAASLYVYVANREELFDLLFDRIAGEIVLPARTKKRWRQQLHEIAHDMLRVFAKYPGSSQLALARVPTGSNAVRVSDAVIGHLHDGGISDDARAYAMDLLGLYITSIAYEASMREMPNTFVPTQKIEQMLEEVDEAFRSLDPEEYPNIAAIADRMTMWDGEERFDWGLDIIINGLIATPHPGANSR